MISEDIPVILGLAGVTQQTLDEKIDFFKTQMNLLKKIYLARGNYPLPGPEDISYLIANGLVEVTEKETGKTAIATNYGCHNLAMYLDLKNNGSYLNPNI